MEDNKNQDMSVDELLEMLKASLEDDDKKEQPVDEPAEVKPEESGDAEETVVEEEAEEEATPDEPVSEESATLKINQEDLFAAWGITGEDVKVSEQIAEENAVEEAEVSEPTVESAPPAYTKVYFVTRVESKEEYRIRKATETQRKTTDFNRTDCSLIKQALGMEKITESEDGQEFFTVENEKADAPVATIDAPTEEFTYQRQAEDISENYRRFLRGSALKLTFTAVVTLLLFLVECLPTFGVALPSFLSAEYYPVVFAMVTMQLAWIASAFCYKEIANGFLAMRRSVITSGSVLGFLLLFVTVCDVVNCAMGTTANVFNFSVAFSALLVRIFDYMNIRRESLAFEVVSFTQEKKRVMLSVDAAQANKIMGLDDYCGEDSMVLRTERCSFVENYFARTKKSNDGECVSNKYLLPLVFAVSAAVAVVCMVKGTVADGITAFGGSCAVGLPMLILLSSAYPLYKAATKLARFDSTVVGESSVEEYSGTTMICFDDADAFPSYGVTLENLRIYGNGDIETIIEQMDAVFSKLGGPLHSVFGLMIAECPKPYRVKIDALYDDGVKATVDGKTLYIGSYRFMEKNGFVVTDKTSEIGGKIFSTMYLAEDGALRAKFFIKYTLEGSFEAIIKKLARRGIASVILTGDANINDELLAQFMDISKLPVKVVRRALDDAPSHSDRADSGLVSAGGVKDVVEAVMMCDKLAGIIGTMRAVRIASAIICALVVLAIGLLNMAGLVSSVHILVYHLFWLIPTWLVTKINLG